MAALVFALLILLNGFSVAAAVFHVEPKGDDKAAGSESKPFRTIQKAAELMQTGDTCVVHGGTYRESVQVKNGGAPGKPVRFEAAAGAKVVIDGTELVAGPWSVYRGQIFKARTDRSFTQLFCDGQMMVEARWPNRRFPEQLWERACWAQAAKGSRYGKMVDPKLAETGIDWTGAIAVLNGSQKSG